MTQQVTLSPQSGAWWQWRDQSIYYVRSGRSQNLPAILLIHGFGASTAHWRKNIAALGTEFEVWAIDLLGFGRSAKPDWQYSGDLWRQQIHDFIQQVIGRPAVLVGNSLGGYVALTVAANFPDWANGLVLLNSAGPFTDATDPKPAQGASLQQWLRNIIQQILAQEWASFLLFQYLRQRSTIRRTLEQVYLDRSAVTDQLVEEIYLPSCDPGAAKVFASVFKSRQGEKVDQLLQKLCRPLLMLWGEGDPWMDTRQRGAQFRQHYPNLTEVYLQAGHCPHDELPEQVNGLIRDWVFSKVRA